MPNSAVSLLIDLSPVEAAQRMRPTELLSWDCQGTPLGTACSYASHFAAHKVGHGPHHRPFAHPRRVEPIRRRRVGSNELFTPCRYTHPGLRCVSGRGDRKPRSALPRAGFLRGLPYMIRMDIRAALLLSLAIGLLSFVNLPSIAESPDAGAASSSWTGTQSP